MSEFFDRNCQALAKEKGNQRLVARLKETAIPTDIDVIETGDGSLGLVFNGVPLHSISGAVTEAQQLVKENCKPHQNGLHILFGLGLGYPLAELSAATKAYPDSQILVFEPNLSLLRFVLENVDITPFCENRRLIINNHPIEFFKIFQENYIWKKTEIDFTILPSALQLNSDSIKHIMGKVPQLIESQQQTLQVGLTLSQAWVEHFFKIVPYWPQTQPFQILDGLFNDKPAVVVSAGPSLDKAIADLKSYQDKVIIIAVGRALRPLMRAGILPDFAVFLDYEGQAAQLDNLPQSTENLHFILGPYTEEAVFQVPSQSLLMAHMHKYPLVPWVDNILGTSHTPVDVIGTVSYLGLQAAYTMGCSPIILLGQDLAFNQEKQYADGALNSNQRIEDGHLILEESESYMGTKLPLMEVTGQQGEKLLSTQDYIQYKLSLENFAELCQLNDSDRELINASTGGVFINGFQHLSLSEILAAKNSISKNEVLQHLKQEPNPGTINEQYEKLASGAQQFVEKLETLILNTEKSSKILNQVFSLNDWQQSHPKFHALKEEFKRLIDNDSLLSLIIAKASYHLNNGLKSDVTTWEDQKYNLEHMKQFLKNCREAFSSLNTVVKETHSNIQEKIKQTVPVSSSLR